MKQLVPLLVVAALAAACDSSHAARETFRIAMVPKGSSHQFWKSVHCGAAQADEEFADVEIVWKAPLGEGDVAQQIALLETFTADRFDGICVAPLDMHGLLGAVRTAIDRDVAVLIFDSPLAHCDLPLVGTVATDNRRGGEMAGAELARLLNGEGNVIVLRYMNGSYSTNLREEGCRSELAKFPRIRVLADDAYAGPDESHAVEVAERLLATHGDRVQGVFCSNESTASGFLTALARDPRGLAKRIRVVGFDTSERIVAALESGTLAATVVQDPTKMGYAAISTMRAHLRGEATQSVVETGQTLITPETMDEPGMRALLVPPVKGR
jgi:ribose transport system substrate-binding protein